VHLRAMAPPGGEGSMGTRRAIRPALGLSTPECARAWPRLCAQSTGRPEGIPDPGSGTSLFCRIVARFPARHHRRAVSYLRPPRLSGAARNLAIVLLILSTLAGCTTLHVFGADGVQATTLRFPGFVDITFDSRSGALGYIRSTYGLGASADGIALGYASTAAVRITDPSACQAVILVANEEAAREVFRLVAELGAKGQGLCIEKKEDPK
jgi:hypothetical protein